MYHYSSRSDDFGTTLVLLSFIAALLLAWVIVRLLSFVLRTFVRHNKNMALWIALAVCIVCCSVGLLLSVRVSQAFVVFPIISIGGFLIVCLVVSLRSRQTLLPESVNLVHQVLHSPWLTDEDTPIQSGNGAVPLAA